MHKHARTYLYTSQNTNKKRNIRFSFFSNLFVFPRIYSLKKIFTRSPLRTIERRKKKEKEKKKEKKNTFSYSTKNKCSKLRTCFLSFQISYLYHRISLISEDSVMHLASKVTSTRGHDENAFSHSENVR